MIHTIRPVLLSREVKVLLIGAGGTGSHVATDLARLHLSLVALGHPGGFKVTIADGDTVSEANIGRQIFYDADIGRNKADVVVNRLNVCYGLGWTSYPEFYAGHGIGQFDIVISCVDSAKARRGIARSFRGHLPSYWLDMGNKEATGQIVLGEPVADSARDWRMRLPTVTELFPSLLDETVAEDDTPSCSLAEALEKQELFINKSMALYGMQILWQLFRYGGTDYHGVFVNLKSGRSNPLPVCKSTWKRMGYVSHARKAR